jgi:hypothetical protein
MFHHKVAKFGPRMSRECPDDSIGALAFAIEKGIKPHAYYD